jgi:hypothetical protein
LVTSAPAERIDERDNGALQVIEPEVELGIVPPILDDTTGVGDRGSTL